MLYKAIKFWPDAYHVFDGEKRIGIVNMHTVRINGCIDRVIWQAHNHNFFTIRGEFESRTEAAAAITKGSLRDA